MVGYVDLAARRTARTRWTLSTAAYQCGAQTPSSGRGPAGHDSIASSNSMPTAAQSWRSTPRGSRQHVAGVDDGRGGAEGVAAAAEQVDLLREAEVLQRGLPAHLGVGGERPAAGSRIRNAFVSPTASPAPTSGSMWWVMCFWYQTERPSGMGPVSQEDDGPPVVVLRGEDLVTSRMVDARRGQVVGVERLVDDRRCLAGCRTSASSPCEMLRGPDHIAMRTSLTRRSVRDEVREGAWDRAETCR